MLRDVRIFNPQDSLIPTEMLTVMNSLRVITDSSLSFQKYEAVHFQDQSKYPQQ